MRIQFETHFNTWYILPSVFLWTEPEHYMYLEFWFLKWGITVQLYDRKTN